MPLNVIMMGPPGAGKGTQAERFASFHGIPKVSTGDILRDAVHRGMALGRQAQAVMDRGELVGDDVMIGIVEERLGREDALKGFVLDGFPRTVAQARALDRIMDGRGPLIVIDIVVPEAELTRRLRDRRICSVCGNNAGAFPGDDGSGRAAASSSAGFNCQLCGGTLVPRTDDDERVLAERLRVYQRDTKPLVDFYQGRPSFRSINGAQPPDRVAQELESAVDSALGDPRDLWRSRLEEEAR